MRQMTVGAIRAHHRYLVLRELLQRPLLQRGELAAATGVSAMTIKKVVEDLLARGLVCETKVEGGAGRRPQALALAPQYGCVACVGLSSAASIEARLVDVSGRALFSAHHPLGADQTATLRAALVGLAEQVEEHGLTCVGLGMAVPGVYSSQLDKISGGPAAFSGLHPRALAEEYFPEVAIHILQDVHAAALAHYLESGAASLYYLYLGDEVYGCLVQGGTLLAGANAVAGAVGQCLPPPGSGAETLGQLLSPAGLRARLGLGEGQPLADAYGMNMELFEEAAGHAARFIYNLGCIVDPGEIVVGSSDPFLASLAAQRAVALAEQAPRSGQGPPAVRKARSSLRLAGEGLFGLVLDAWLQAAAK